MKTRDVLLPSITTIILATFLVFVSCASKDTVQEDGAPLEKVEGSTDPLLEGQNSDPMSEDTLPQLSNDSTSSTEGTQVALGEGAPKTDELVEPQSTPQTSESSPIAENALSSEPTTVKPVESLEDLKAMMGSDTPETSSEPKASRPRSARRASGGGNKVPHISDAAIQKRGALLNRFYFTRRGDTPQRVSNLLYGSPQNAKALVRWNGGDKNWHAGKLLYYASASDPTDKTMQSFYQERSVPPTEYSLKRGDWLSKIAKVRLGDARSWKEIAVVSGIEKPHSVEVGQRLLLYPEDLSPYTVDKVAPKPAEEVPKQVVQAPEPVAPPVAQIPEPQVAVPPAPEAAPIPPKAEAPSRKGKKEAGGLDLAKLLEQNAIFGLFAAIALPILILLVLVNKRRRAKRQEEMGAVDDNTFSSSAPRKLKRK